MNNQTPHASDSVPAGFRLRNLILPIYLPHLLLTFTIGLTLPTLPLLGQSLAGSDFLAALPITSRYIGTALGDVPASMLMSRFGSKNTAIIGIFLLIVAALLIILFNNYATLLASRLLEGIGLALWLVSRQTFIAIAVPNTSHGRASSIVGGLFRIGLLAGAPVGGFLASGGIPFPNFLGLDELLYAPFYLQFVLSCIILIMFVLTSKKSHYAKNSWRGIPTAINETIKQNLGIFLLIGSIALIIQSLRAAREILIPLLGDKIGLDTGEIGLVQATSGAFDAMLFPISGYVMDKYGRKFSGVPALLILSIGIGLLAIAFNWWLLVIAAILIGIGNGISSGIIITIGADLAPSNHPSEFIGLWRVMADTGAAVGPSVAGAISTSAGLAVASLSVMGIGFVGLVILVLFVPETLNKKHKDKPS